MSLVPGGQDCVDFSVVVTLMEHRGLAEGCVASWVRDQTYPRGRYELIVVSDGASRRLERRLRALLPVPHRLLSERSNNETELYHLGATAARGRWLLFNESHCVAEPNYLDALSHFLGGGWDAAVGVSVGVCANMLARMDERLFLEGMRHVREHDDWRKVSVHGFAIRRDLYEELGGLDPRFDRFAEWVLAARLRDRGARVGFADGARVRHHYRTGLWELLPSIASYCRGEWAWRRAGLREPRITEPFWPPEWTADLPPEPSLARAVVRAGGRAGGPVRATARWGDLARYGGEVLGLLGAMLRCRLARRLDGLDRDYREVWRRVVRLAELRLRDRHAAETTPLRAVGPCEIARLPAEHLFGFHPTETYRGAAFRWSGPVAAVRLALPAGEFEVILDAGPLGGELARLEPDASLDGTPLPAGSVVARDGAAVFRVSVRGAERRGRWLVFRCRPLRPRDHGVADDRELGLPVFGVRVAPAPAEGSARAA